MAQRAKTSEDIKKAIAQLEFISKMIELNNENSIEYKRQPYEKDCNDLIELLRNSYDNPNVGVLICLAILNKILGLTYQERQTVKNEEAGKSKYSAGIFRSPDNGYASDSDDMQINQSCRCVLI